MGEPLNWRKCKTLACPRRVGGGAAFCCRDCHHAATFNQETSSHSAACDTRASHRGPWDAARDSPF